MSIQITCITAAIKKSAVLRDYPGGTEGFRADYPDADEDGYIFGLTSTTDSGLIETLQRIGDAGLSLIECCAVGDQHVGPIERHPHFEFHETQMSSNLKWEVRLIDDDPGVLADEGARLFRHFIREGWSISLGMEGDSQ
jgi:hypothetical protein